MIIDCHAHFDPRMLSLPDLVTKMDGAGVDRVALIPAMVDPLNETPEALLAILRRVMDSKARPLAERIHRLTLTREGHLRLGRQVFRIYRHPDNDAVVRALGQHPDRFLGWIFLNPRHDPSVLETLERYRGVSGMIGVKLHPHWHDYRTELLEPLLERMEALGLPALVHFGFGPRGDFRALCEAHPKLPIIAAHAGFPFYSDLWKHGPDLPNLFVDLSSPYIDERLARRAVEVLGPERCLYGTDSPFGFHDADGSYDYGAIRRWVERMPVSSAGMERIFAGNFLEIIAERR